MTPLHPNARAAASDGQEVLLDMLVPIVAVSGFWIAIVALGVAGFMTSQRATRELHETARRAVEAGQVLPPEALQALRRPARSPGADRRTGTLLVSAAAGLALCAALLAATEAGDDWRGFAMAGLLVGTFGIGHLVASRVRSDG